MFCTPYIVWHHGYKLHLNTLQFVKLDVQNFNPFSFPVLIPLFWPFVTGSDESEWDYMTGVLDSAVAQITGDCQTKGPSCPWIWRHYIPLKHRELLTQQHSITSIKTSVLRNNAMRTSNPAYFVAVLQTSCYVPYCSIQTWRLRYQRGQISCYEWEWHLPQHFCKLLL